MRRFRRCVLYVSCSFLAIVGVPHVASADPPSSDLTRSGVADEGVDLNCFGSAILNFDPGLSVGAEPQQITGSMRGGTALSSTTPCSSATGVPYKGGVAEIRGTGELGCAAVGSTGLVGEASGTAHIVWDNGDTSVAEWSAASYGALPVVDISITDGALKGAQVFQQGTVTGLTGNCATEPLTRGGFSGAATLIR